MTEYEYELELEFSVGKLRVRAQTFQELIEKINSVSFDSLSKLGKGVKSQPTPLAMTAESVSLPEFISQCTLTTQLDTALVCCYYLSVIEGEKLINKNDIESAIQQAMLSRINNPNQTLNDLVTRAHLARAKERKSSLVAYYLTRKGKEYVEQKLVKAGD